MTYETDDAAGNSWAAMLGDSCERLAEIETDSVDLSICSPPFASLFVYTASDRDLGNSATRAEFIEHYSYVVREQLRVTKPGRLACVHVQQLTTSKATHGVSGLTDFRGDVIRAFIAGGWIFHGEVTVDKDPQQQAIRTKAQALMFVQLHRDSAMSRPALADYVLLFRKPGVNAVPIDTDVDNDTWIQWARPVWYDIRETDTLNTRAAKENADERHICLAEGSLVLTRDGHIPIEDVRVGDLVLTHEGRWRPVEAKRCNGVAEIVRTCAQGVADLRTTPDHELWARRGSGRTAKQQAIQSPPEWTAADRTLGAYLNLKLPPVEDSPLTDDEWWIVGRWLGDGHRGVKRAGHGHAPYLISCAHDEVAGLVERLGHRAGHIATRTASQIALRELSSDLRAVLDRCGTGAAGKRVPGEALSLSREKAESLLAGYLSADGHYVAAYDRWTASSVSRALLLGMAMVAQRARGVVASVYAGRGPRKHTIEGRVVEAKQDWVFAFRNSTGYRQSGWVADDGSWKKVRKIEPVDNAIVWDLRVADDSSFVAEGAVVKNCPLQLPLIERCVRLWSNRGDLVLSPFMGIGSEGVVAIEQGRRFTGCELKRAYYDTAVDNLRDAEQRMANVLPILAEAE